MRKTCLWWLLLLQVYVTVVLCFAHASTSTSNILASTTTSAVANGLDSSAVSSTSLPPIPSLKDKIAKTSTLKHKLSALRATSIEFEDVIPNDVPHKTAVPLPTEEIAKNIWLKMSFSWVKNLMKTGNKRPLQMYDLWTMAEKDQMLECSTKFEELFQQEKSKVDSIALSTESSSKSVEGGKKKKKKYWSILKDFWQSPLTKAILLM